MTDLLDLLDSAYKAEQLSVFLENRAGRLAEIIHLLAKANINIRAVSLADTSDFGILRMMLNDLPKAEELLKSHGFTTGRTSVVAVELPDKPGSLDNLLQLLCKNDINVEYMYAYARCDLACAIMVFRFDRIDKAIEVLRASKHPLVPSEKLCAF